MLGKLTGQDEADAAEGVSQYDKAAETRALTRSGSHATRWWTSCCMRQAWRPRWRRARRCLNLQSVLKRVVKGETRTVDEGVQDGHGTVGDTGVGVDLLED